MTDRKKVFILRIINALLFIIFIFIQYNGIFNLRLMSANPMLPLALLVACCMFASEFTSAFTGLAVGIFVDGVSSTASGFIAIIFMVIAVAVSLIAKHLFNNNVFAAFTLCLLCCIFYFTVRWIFCFAFSLSFTENLTYLMSCALPSAVYTAVLIIPMYFLQKFLYNKFYFLHHN